MTDQEARYDRIAEGYARWWSPVHRPATLALLDRIAPLLEPPGDPETRILDVGCGTAALASAAVTRWPGVRVTGVDMSSGMLAVADRELSTLPASARARVALVQAPADRLPFDPGTYHVVVSSFVLQLVPSAHRAMREARRVLVPGGTLAVAVWLAGGSFPADEACAAGLLAAGLEPATSDGRGDPGTPEAVAARLRRAGFAAVDARATEVDHRFTPASYLAFVAGFDDEDLFSSLAPATRAALEADLLRRLDALGPGGLRMRLPVAIATGRRSGRA